MQRRQAALAAAGATIATVEVGSLTRGVDSPLTAAAVPLLGLAARLRTMSDPVDVDAVRDCVVRELHGFAEACRAAGIRPDVLDLSRHAVAAMIDDVVMGTPWGADSDWRQRTMASATDVDDDGGSFHERLDRMLQSPDVSRPVLRLVYECLSLGLLERLPGPTTRDETREKVWRTLRRLDGPIEPELSPQWRGLDVPPGRQYRRVTPWLMVALAALLSLLMWFGFDLLTKAGADVFANVPVRTAVIAVIVLLVSLPWFLRRRRERKADDDLVDGLAPAVPADDAAAIERQVLAEKLKAALAELRRIFGREGRALSDIPWYAMIGPPGAGKTTALRNAGLGFPLAARDGVGPLFGVAGTRGYEFWFTDKAVILDTAGRHVVQDDGSGADHAGWGALLDVLRRTRQRRPLNGVLAMISIHDLLSLPRDYRTGHARALRARLAELQSALGFAPPVYVVLTKLDMVAGFVEFFDDLDREARQQVLGLTLPPGTGNRDDMPHRLFPAALDRLVERQHARLLDRLHDERDLDRRTLIHGFPCRFASVGSLVEAFLADVFDESLVDVQLSLRGVYFTSGTQEGSPIDSLMHAMSSKLGVAPQRLPMQTGTGRGFFLHQLFNDVILGEARVAGTRAGAVNRRRRPAAAP